MRLACLIACFCSALLCVSCGNAGKGPAKPAKAGTAEQLAGTRWAASGGTLTFLPGGRLQFLPKTDTNSPLPMPNEPLTGNYVVAEGIVRASVANTMPFAGTWDGEKLTIGGEECTRLATQ